MSDPRDHLFTGLGARPFTARLIADEVGIVAGTGGIVACFAELGIAGQLKVEEGGALQPGTVIAQAHGSAKQMALAEERFVGLLAKPSGIATATARFVQRAGPSLRVVSGAWKKLPFSQKEMIRSAVLVGGAQPRIAEWPFAYIDKNFVRMLGGVSSALRAAGGLDTHKKIIQIKGEFASIADEAVEAARGGANIVFVDTGVLADASSAVAALQQHGLRDRVELAFAGGVQLEELDALRQIGIDIVDIGRPIVDAPLLDMRVEVEREH